VSVWLVVVRCARSRPRIDARCVGIVGIHVWAGVVVGIHVRTGVGIVGIHVWAGVGIVVIVGIRIIGIIVGIHVRTGVGIVGIHVRTRVGIVGIIAGARTAQGRRGEVSLLHRGCSGQRLCGLRSEAISMKFKPLSELGHGIDERLLLVKHPLKFFFEIIISG